MSDSESDPEANKSVETVVQVEKEPEPEPVDDPSPPKQEPQTPKTKAKKLSIALPSISIRKEKDEEKEKEKEEEKVEKKEEMDELRKEVVERKSSTASKRVRINTDSMPPSRKNTVSSMKGSSPARSSISSIRLVGDPYFIEGTSSSPTGNELDTPSKNPGMEKEVKFRFPKSGASVETTSNESERLMESDDDGNIQIEVPMGPRGRMGRRFTLNPLIFAKEEKEARRQSLAQLKLSYYPKSMNPESYDAGLGFCGWMLMFLSWLVVLVTFPVSTCFCIKVVQEYERAVIFRLGRLIGGGAKGPGIFFVLPCIESYTKVDLRTVSFNVPPQEILTKDSVTTSVDAVVYYRVSNATVSVANVENAHHSTRLLAQTTLRNMLGTRSLAEILSDRDALAISMQAVLDEATESWGIKVERVEIKDVRLPVQLQRAMAAEAEATREARAKVIAAEGEQKASRSLRDAATVIASSPAALQLRYLQTLNSVAAEKNSTIIFPLPMELVSHFLKS